jgi:PBP1b-binding outer membrane lipoprotein LpoB
MKHLIIILILLSSCSAEKRLNRLIVKHPELVKVDTVKIIDTVIIDSYHFDTTTKFIEHKTIEVVNNEKVRLQYHYDTITNEIWHQVECKGDTIIKTHEVTHPTIVNQIDYFSGWYKWSVLLLLVVIVVGAIKILK